MGCHRHKTPQKLARFSSHHQSLPGQPSLAHQLHNSDNMSTSHTDSSTSVVTLNIFALTNFSPTKNPNCAHSQTKEFKYPLTAPGGFVFDPSSLMQLEHLNTLIKDRACEFCSQPPTGFMSVRFDYTPWIDFADQIHGRSTLPLRARFPFSLMSVGLLAGSFGQGEETNAFSMDTNGEMAFSERLKDYGFYTPHQSCVVIATCKKPICNTKAKQTIEEFEPRLGLSPELPIFAQPFTTALGQVVCQYCGDTNIKLCKKNGKYCGFG
ncbi:hypothetical protein ES702_04614 [subsurface metagenome]